MNWQLPARTISLDRPFIMGIVNATPDSFSDGGWLPDADAAVEYAERLLDTGADCVDIGGQSTRPNNSGPVSVDEELGRVLPVISMLRLTRLPWRCWRRR
jgi:dihydropteroate synthase